MPPQVDPPMQQRRHAKHTVPVATFKAEFARQELQHQSREHRALPAAAAGANPHTSIQADAPRSPDMNVLLAAHARHAASKQRRHKRRAGPAGTARQATGYSCDSM